MFQRCYSFKHTLLFSSSEHFGGRIGRKWSTEINISCIGEIDFLLSLSHQIALHIADRINVSIHPREIEF
jgi:hypothetical protein